MLEYNKLLEKAKEAYKNCATDAEKRMLESIFPELKESEDEKIMKAIIGFFELQDDNTTYFFIPKRDILAWLEKQGKQKNVWSEDDEKMVNSIIEEIRPYGECPDYPTNEEREYYYNRSKMVDWLISLKQQSIGKPNEEQIKAFEHFVRSIGESGYASPYDNNTKLIYSLLNDLKKL